MAVIICPHCSLSQFATPSGTCQECTRSLTFACGSCHTDQLLKAGQTTCDACGKPIKEGLSTGKDPTLETSRVPIPRSPRKQGSRRSRTSALSLATASNTQPLPNLSKPRGKYAAGNPSGKFPARAFDLLVKLLDMPNPTEDIQRLREQLIQQYLTLEFSPATTPDHPTAK